MGVEQEGTEGEVEKLKRGSMNIYGKISVALLLSLYLFSAWSVTYGAKHLPYWIMMCASAAIGGLATSTLIRFLIEFTKN